MSEPRTPPAALQPSAAQRAADPMASAAARSLALSYALHAAIQMAGRWDRDIGALGEISADLIRELHTLDRRLSQHR